MSENIFFEVWQGKAGGSWNSGYEHLKVSIYGGEEAEREGTIYTNPRATFTWQRNVGEENAHWYGFGIEVNNYHTDLSKLADMMQMLRRIESRLKAIYKQEQEAKGDGWYWGGGFCSDITPEQIGEALKRVKAQQIVNDRRIGFVLIENVKEDGLKRYHPRNYSGYTRCSFAAWAADEQQAQIAILAEWSRKLNECTAQDRACSSCMGELTEWTRNGMRVEAQDYPAPAVQYLPTWELPKLEQPETAEVEVEVEVEAEVEVA